MIEDWERLVWARKHRAFLDAIQPFLKMKTYIYMISMPSMTIYDDGRIEADYRFSEGQKQVLAYADEAIEAAKRSVYYGVDVPYPKQRETLFSIGVARSGKMAPIVRFSL